MQPGFSETTFSHAVYGEFLRTLHSFHPPFLPSTVEEFYIPFDLEWSFSATRSLFFQFKVSQYLDHPRAKQRADVGCPYFRFYLHQSHGACTQHNLLKDLSDTFPHDVFYVAPLFYTYDEYVQLFRPPNIVNNSVFVDLAPMSVFTDSDRHCVAYNRSRIHECSESHGLGDVVTGQEFLRRFKPDAEKRERLAGADDFAKTLDYLKSTRDSLITILRTRGFAAELLEPPRIDWRRRLFPYVEIGPPDFIYRLVQVATEIDYLSRTFFGALWVGLA